MTNFFPGLIPVKGYIMIGNKIIYNQMRVRHGLL